jgi:glycosidase
MSRIYSVVDSNINKQKMGIEWLLTCRGIPQLYYGTEICMGGYANPDGNVRRDFPGGWDGDKKNAFTGEGLSDDEKSVQALTKTLGNFRKTSSALKTGKLMQYTPTDGLYVYFRYNAKQTIMCIMNTSDKAKDIDFSKYTERTAGFTKATSVVSSDTYNTSDKPTIGSYNMWVLELGK